MTNTLEFTSATRRREPLTFTLDGTTYTFAPPKSAVMMLPVYTGDASFIRASYDWFESGLNNHDWAQLDDAGRRAAHGLPETPEDGQPLTVPPLPPEGWQGAQAATLEARLRDPGDTFDTEDLDDLINGLSEAVAGRPTT